MSAKTTKKIAKKVAKKTPVKKPAPKKVAKKSKAEKINCTDEISYLDGEEDMKYEADVSHMSEELFFMNKESAAIRDCESV